MGFTLVELMIVVIIVGILAAVAIPMYSGATEKARATECVAALGTIRSALRNYYAEHVTYVNADFVDGAQVTNGGILEVADMDLNGRYFSTECYTFDGDAGANTYRIKCDGDASTAPAAGDVAGVVRYIDQNGEITTS
jgi:prepilin-type N-terminal cleavage/methylation domain-containing protein